MLTAYYSRGCDSEAMFSGLEISNAPDFKKHLNQYDAIHLDIQWCINTAGVPYRNPADQEGKNAVCPE